MSQKYLTKKVFFLSFSQKSAFLIKCDIKNGFLTHFHSRNVYFYIHHVIVQKLQHSIFKKNWVHTLKNLTFFTPIFCLICHPSVYHSFLKEKHPILTNLGAFYNNSPKIYPIYMYVIWAPLSLMKPPPPRTLYEIWQKSTPKGRQIYVYHVIVNVRISPPPGTFCFRFWQYILLTRHY